MKNIPTTYTMTGSRKEQQDRFYTHPIFGEAKAQIGYILAVLDGHRGEEAVETVLRGIKEAEGVLEHAIKLSKVDKGHILRALYESLVIKTRRLESGTTLVLALIDYDSRLVSFLNIGDSVGMIVHKQKIAFLTTPHNSRTNKEDRDALERMGAYYLSAQGYFVNEVGSGIQLTRTLGDSDFPFLIREPEIKHHELTEGDYVVLASDGVIPTHSAEKAKESIETIRKHLQRVKPTAESLTLATLHPDPQQDNATALLFQF